MPKKHKTGVRRKVTLLIFLSTLILTVVAISFVYIVSSALLHRTIGENYTKAAYLLANYVAEVIDKETKHIVAYMDKPTWEKDLRAVNMKYDTMDEAARKNYFKEMDRLWTNANQDSPLVKEYTDSQVGIRFKHLTDDLEDVGEIFVTDKFGGLVASSDRTTDFYQADEEWWQKAYDGGKGSTFLGNIEFDEHSGSWSMPLAVPVRDDTGGVIGVCKATIDTQRLFKRLEEFNIGRTGHAALIDEKGRFIFHSGIIPLSEAFANGAEPAALLKNKKGYVVLKTAYQHEGDMFTAFADITAPIFIKNGIYWRAFIMEDSWEIFAPIRTLVLALLIVMIVVMAMIIPVSYIFEVIFVRPIIELHHATERVMEGDWNYKIEVKTGDEIEEFADIFKEMIAKIKDKEETILKVNAALEDLSKNLENRVEERTQELKEARERAELLYNIIPSAVFTVDKNRRITSWNNKAAELTGYGSAEAIGKDCGLFVDFPCSKSCGLYDGDLEKPVIGEECIIIKKGGEKRFIMKNVDFLRDDKDGIMGGIESFEDVTERKRLEKVKDEFIATVSHELRTPLSITKEGIGLILDRIPGDINEKQAKILGMTKDNIDRLAHIINDLLDMSKIEAGKMRVEKKKFDIIDAVKKIIASFEIKLKEKNIELKTDLPPTPVEINADSDRVSQIFTNLIGNAVKFTPGGYVEVSVKEKPDRIECFVRDSGIGIAKEDIPRAFGKFQQFGRPIGTGEKGTGLGLSITKAIVDMHNGKIWVESELGKGTKVTFTLPKA